MAQRKVSASYTLYIPENLNLDQIILNTPPDFKYHKDYFVYILHLINDILTKHEDKDYDSAPLYSSLLKARIGNDYRKYLTYLVENNILVENTQYIVGKKSKSFSFAEEYALSKLVPVTITKSTLIKSLKKFINLNEEGLRILPDFINADYDYILKWLNNKLTINVNGAESLLNDLFLKEIWSCPLGKEGAVLKKMYRRGIAVSKIDKTGFYPHFDTTSGRLHTPLTQLKKELRMFLKYDGKKLVSIDIKNSQPYLSTILFNEETFKKNKVQDKINLYNNIDYNKSPISFYYVSKKDLPLDIKNYIKQVVSGKFYEEFAEVLKTENLLTDKGEDIRKTAKIIAFRTMFSPNSHKQHVKEIQLFERVYPNVYKNFAFLKKGKDKYNTLACLLQNIEAELILKIICKEISVKLPNAPIFTIHDSIITTVDYHEKVKQIMYNILKDKVGYAPELSIEFW